MGPFKCDTFDLVAQKSSQHVSKVLKSLPWPEDTRATRRAIQITGLLQTEMGTDKGRNETFICLASRYMYTVHTIKSRDFYKLKWELSNDGTIPSLASLLASSTNIRRTLSTINVRKYSRRVYDQYSL